MRSRALALLLMLPAAALAADAPPVQDWSKDGEIVVVVAPKPGPALWHISQNGSDVWIMGVVSPIPHDLKWNTAALDDVITGARQVYLQPRLTAGFLEASWFLLTGLHKLKLQDGQTLQTVLPEDLKSRYAAWLAKLGKDPGKDDEYLLGLHRGARSGEDVPRSRRARSRTGQPNRTHRGPARRAKPKPLSVYQAMPIVNEIQTLSPENERACLKDALDDIDVQAPRMRTRQRAPGRLATLRASKPTIPKPNFSNVSRKPKPSPPIASRRRRMRLDAVHASLAAPGKSLIVISMGTLLRQGGLLDRLKQQNIVVEGPPE